MELTSSPSFLRYTINTINVAREIYIVVKSRLFFTETSTTRITYLNSMKDGGILTDNHG